MKPDSVRGQTADRILIANATTYPNRLKSIVHQIEPDEDQSEKRYWELEELDERNYQWIEKIRDDYYERIYRAVLPMLTFSPDSILIVTGNRRKRSSLFACQWRGPGPFLKIDLTAFRAAKPRPDGRTASSGSNRKVSSRGLTTSGRKPSESVRPPTYHDRGCITDPAPSREITLFSFAEESPQLISPKLLAYSARGNAPRGIAFVA